MNEVDAERLIQLETEALLKALARPKSPEPPPLKRPTIHYTELPEDTSNSPNSQEWNFYRREVGRLLAEGQEGMWLLIKGEEIIGIWETQEEALQAAREKYPEQHVLIHQILTCEPVIRVSLWYHRWPS